ncbi:hypothetical protein BDN70DRAFT_901554 [Pholiota conissans]|uniref:Uncharacterized protein n=1 Tax=Pholiota conissans TaxID=109636 RepID=A0A9P5YM76_9AGAR|nr:hypothetical protein BDN70DRAFT_901554 [Pholiota conissans]
MVLSATRTTPLTPNEAAQNRFIKSLGPYYRQAKLNDQLEVFLERVFNIWRFRWPLLRSEYIDNDFMEAAWISIKKKKALCLYWASFTESANTEYDWESYLAICEARAGIAKTPSNLNSNSSSSNSEPIQPRPKPKKRAVLINHGIVTAEDLPQKWRDFGSE